MTSSTSPAHSAPNRRDALRLAGAAGGVVALAGTGTVLLPASAHAATTPTSYAPGNYPATAVLSQANRHLVDRFTPGATPALVGEVTAAGSGYAWLKAQIARGYDTSTDAVADWWPDLHLDAQTIWQRQLAGTRGSWQVMFDYGNRTMARRILSPTRCSR